MRPSSGTIPSAIPALTMSSTNRTPPDEDVRTFIQANRDLIGDVLRYSQDPYARACALVLLKRGGTERDVDAIADDLNLAREQVR